jgi:hypothetical protein
MNRADFSLNLVMVLLGSLCCCFTPAAAALQCPSDVVTPAALESTSTATNITLLTGKSYKLGAGVFVLKITVEVDGPEGVIWCAAAALSSSSSSMLPTLLVCGVTSIRSMLHLKSPTAEHIRSPCSTVPAVSCGRTAATNEELKLKLHFQWNCSSKQHVHRR